MPRLSTRDTALIVALGLGQIVAYASSFYLFGTLADPIARDLRTPASLIFGLLSASMLAAGIAGPAIGRLIDRCGAKPVLLASNLVFAAALLLLSIARGPIGLSAGVLLLGAGMATGLYGTPHALAVQHFGERARPAITVVSLLGGFGSTIGWFLTASVAAQFGWRIACAGWAGAHLLICLPAVALLARGGLSSAHDENGPPVVWDAALVRMAVLFAGAWLVSTCMAAHLPRLLQGVGLTPFAAASVAGLLGVAAVTARLVELTLLRGASPLATARFAALLHPIGALALLAFGAPAAPLFVIAQGLGNGLLSVANGTLPLAIYGRHGYGARAGLMNLPAKIVQPAGPLVFSIAYEAAGPAALVLTSAICLAMFSATLGLPRRG